MVPEGPAWASQGLAPGSKYLVRRPEAQGKKMGNCQGDPGSLEDVWSLAGKAGEGEEGGVGREGGSPHRFETPLNSESLLAACLQESDLCSERGQRSRMQRIAPCLPNRVPHMVSSLNDTCHSQSAALRVDFLGDERGGGPPLPEGSRKGLYPGFPTPRHSVSQVGKTQVSSDRRTGR